MTIWVYQSQPGDTCMWEGGSVLDHARRWGREGTLPDPAAAGSDVLINSDIAVQLLFQLLYPPADFIYITFRVAGLWIVSTQTYQTGHTVSRLHSFNFFCVARGNQSFKHSKEGAILSKMSIFN